MHASIDDIVAAPAAHDVAVVAARDKVVARPAEDVIAVAAARERVIAAPAFQDVVVNAAVEGVVAASAAADDRPFGHFVQIGHRCLLTAVLDYVTPTSVWVPAIANTDLLVIP